MCTKLGYILWTRYSLNRILLGEFCQIAFTIVDILRKQSVTLSVYFKKEDHRLSLLEFVSPRNFCKFLNYVILENH